MPVLGDRIPVGDRLLARRRIDPVTGCWIWAGGCNRTGYAQIRVYDEAGTRSRRLVHRVAHELFIGPIPEEAVVDHLCRVRACFNPAHLQAVTPVVNNLRSDSPSAVNGRKLYCKRGHAFTEANTRIDPRGSRVCRACTRMHALDRYHRTKVLKTR